MNIIEFRYYKSLRIGHVQAPLHTTDQNIVSKEAVWQFWRHLECLVNPSQRQNKLTKGSSLAERMRELR